MNRRLFVTGTFALAGCASARVDRNPSDFAELEPIYRADAGRDGLTISVGSNGCTAKADFTFFVERRREGVAVAFGRRRIDSCKSFAIGRTDLSFSWAELGLDPTTTVRVLNPLGVWIGPGV